MKCGMVCCAGNVVRCEILVRVSTRVVVVRELFSLVTSAICGVSEVEVRGYEDCLPHDSSFSSTAAF